jgi:hypothetical protein
MGTNFTGPLLVDGAPLGIGQVSPNQRAIIAGGKTLWVGNYPASTSLKSTFRSGNGEEPDAAYSTLAAALLALQNRKNCGDIIYVLPGHIETISAADFYANTGSAEGFSIVSLGSGTMRAVFNWTAAASTWLLDTANVEIANCVLNLCGSSAATTLTVTTPITVSAAGCRIVDCEINWGLDTNTGCGSTLGAIAVVAGTRFNFINNRCINLDTAGTLPVSLLSLNGADLARIVGNIITGGTTSTTVGPVHFVTTASTNVFISNNRIENLKASSTKALTTAIDGVTGTIEYNRFRVQSGIVATTVTTTPFLCSYFQNFTADTDTQNGALDVGAGTST